MSWRGLQKSVTQSVVATTLLFAVGAAHAGTIEQLNTNPAAGPSATNLLGRPVAVAVDKSGQIYDMTHRGWIYSLSPTSTPPFTVQASAKMPGANTGNNSVDFPAVALAVTATATGDVYAGRNNGTIIHYNVSLALQDQITLSTTATNQLVGLTADDSGHVYAATADGTIVYMSSSLVKVKTGGVTPAAGQSAVAIKVDSGGNNLYVALSDGTNGTVYRLNPQPLTTQAMGTVPGVPVNIAINLAGNVAVATTTGLYMLSTGSSNITVLNTWTYTGTTTLVGVSLDDSGDVVAADSGGIVYATGIGLTTPRTVATNVVPTRSITINTTGSLYIVGGPDGASEGDPHITTIDGIHYDFQSAGEFVLFRHNGGREGPACREHADDDDSRHGAVEIQVRQFPLATTGNTCVSLNAAVAARVGEHRVTYEPNLNGQPDPSGLQLRVDKKLVKLSPAGMRLDDGGSIIPTSTPGGLEIDFPDDTVLFVTPGWWPSQSKWYLNVDVDPGRRACGLEGDVPTGSWLPALPDGTSMGPAPTNAHQRYLDLYGRFADAWRVTDKTSLFDYAPGTSTATFTMRSWPPETGVCNVPGAPPAEGASEKVAREACKDVPGDPANCVFDVEITGLKEIAKTYVASRNVQPAQPVPQKHHGCRLLRWLHLTKD